MAKNETTEPTMTYPLPGIFLATGEHGTGKTTFALECGAPPAKIFFIDADTKGMNTAKEFENADMKFGKFVNLIDRLDVAVAGGQSAFDSIWDLVDEIETAKPDVVIFDPINPVYRIFRQHVKDNLTDFDTQKEWTKSRGSGFKFYEGKISRHAREQQEKLLNKISSMVTAVHLTAHLKDAYDADVKVGKVPDVTKVINRITTASFWLRSNPNHTTPIILSIKPYGLKKMEGTKIRTINITPKKAVPKDDENSIWDVIQRYIDDPAHGREPTPDERPDDDDRWILEQTLSDDQKAAWFARVIAKERADDEFEKTLGDLVNPLTTAVQEQISKGVVVPIKIKAAIIAAIDADELNDVDPDVVTLENIGKSL